VFTCTAATRRSANIEKFLSASSPSVGAQRRGGRGKARIAAAGGWKGRMLRLEDTAGWVLGKGFTAPSPLAVGVNYFSLFWPLENASPNKKCKIGCHAGSKSIGKQVTRVFRFCTRMRRVWPASGGTVGRSELEAIKSPKSLLDTPLARQNWYMHMGACSAGRGKGGHLPPGNVVKCFVH